MQTTKIVLFKGKKIRKTLHKKPKAEESLLVRAFAEIMPDVEFIDVTPKTGGDIAGGARKKLEKQLGRSVVSKKNYLGKPESKKLS